MLNKKIVTMVEWDDEEQCYVEYDSIPAVVDDKNLADALAHPLKYIFGAIRKVAAKFVNIYKFTLVDTIDCSYRELGIVHEMYDDPGAYEIRWKDGVARVYLISVLDRFCDTISKFNLHKRLSWLDPFVLQWKLDEDEDELKSEDERFILKAVVA